MRASFLSLILGALPLMAVAEDNPAGPNLRTATPEDPARAASGVSHLALAYELFALGTAQGDALMVLAAARLAAEVDAAPGPELKRKTSGTDPSGLTPEPASAPADAGAMYARAEEMAGDDPLLLELIADAKAATGRGRIGGVLSREAELQPGRTDSWEIPFTGRDYAEISVAGSGASDLNIILSDENGHVLCAETGPGDQIYCDFHPAWDGVFYLAIENAGPLPSRYLLLTN